MEMLPNGTKYATRWAWIKLVWRIYWRGKMTQHTVGGYGKERFVIRIGEESER